MGLTRRNTIIGLGALAGGAGVIGATGAFTTVEADRTVEVTTEGDSAALLGLESNDTDYVAEADDGDTLTIDIDPTGEGEQGTGLNQRARTVIDDLVEITNQGTEEVTSIEFEINTDNDEDQVLSIIPDGFDDGDFMGSDDSVLAPGESETFGVEVDLTSNDPTAVSDYDIDNSNFEPVVTITANTDNS